jgi:hypothetical protein
MVKRDICSVTAILRGRRGERNRNGADVLPAVPFVFNSVVSRAGVFATTQRRKHRLGAGVISGHRWVVRTQHASESTREYKIAVKIHGCDALSSVSNAGIRAPTTLRNKLSEDSAITIRSAQVAMRGPAVTSNLVRRMQQCSAMVAYQTMPMHAYMETH